MLKHIGRLGILAAFFAGCGGDVAEDTPPVELEPTCSDNVLNGTETAIDCGGGECGPCSEGAGCQIASDCDTGVCTGSPLTCAAATCEDEVRNQDETDVDCGGAVCDPCDVGAACDSGSDCESAVCDPIESQCLPAECGDEQQNQDETDVDCGGEVCTACDDGAACLVAEDCASGVCSGEPLACQEPTCEDGVQNGDELGVDCGNSCEAGCAPGTECGGASDCDSGVCTNNECQHPSCNDAVQNGDETDLNCGGSCDPCTVGDSCEVGPDCDTGVCTNDLCQSPTCSDGVQNQDETDQDCGGSICNPCGDGLMCVDQDDCLNNFCDDSVCRPPSCSDTVQNGDETDLNCGGSCGPCADGLMCIGGADCESGVCTNNTCRVPNCLDEVQNGDESDVDCGGSCGGCTNGGSCVVGSDCQSGYCNAGTCEYANSCAQILANDATAESGSYDIDAGAGALRVECDMLTDGGGWTGIALWDRENGADGRTSFLTLMTEEVNDMGDFSDQTGYLRWSDFDTSNDAMSYRIDTSVANGGELLFDIHYHAHSLEQSGVWFFATAGGVQQNLYCWDDASSGYSAAALAYKPTYSCPNDNPATSTVTFDWNEVTQFSLAGPVTTFHIRSLHRDVNLGDHSDLYRFRVFVR